MAFETFKEQAFNRNSRALMERANNLIEYYIGLGYTMTIRQLYYRMVTANYIVNTPTSYKNFARLCNNARLAGKMDWNAIEDRGRFLREIANYENPIDFMRSQFRTYAENLWSDQDNHVEVWMEKDAVVGIIGKACNRFRVPFYSCRGHSSVTGLYEAGKRLRERIDAGKRVIVIYLGDHDPSGLDITRDCNDRVNMFADSIGEVEMRRVALTIEQVRKYKLPPNPAKETDSRAYEYMNLYGRSSWELDALEPNILDEVVTNEIKGLLDMPRFELALAAERENDSKLKMLIAKFPTIERWFEQIKSREA